MNLTVAPTWPFRITAAAELEPTDPKTAVGYYLLKAATSARAIDYTARDLTTILHIYAIDPDHLNDDPAIAAFYSACAPTTDDACQGIGR